MFIENILDLKMTIQCDGKMSETKVCSFTVVLFVCFLGVTTHCSCIFTAQ
jgi:hypothetical protein